MNNPQEYTAKNIRFLRNGIGLSIENLCDILEIDPIDMYLFERDGFSFDSVIHLRQLIALCDYFTIPLEDIIYADIEVAGSIADNLFESLKNEVNGVRFNRKAFRKTYLQADSSYVNDEKTIEDAMDEFNIRMKALELENIKTPLIPLNEDEDEDEDERRNVLRQMLHTLHNIDIISQYYRFIRSKGKIDKIDFFEGGE